MASFGYVAINKSGKEIKGSLEAENYEKARSELKGQGMTILSLEEQSLLSKDIEFNIGGAPTTRDMSVFCRQFVSMVRAGVTILDALKMLTEATENKKLKQAIQGIRVSTEKGESLADAMKEFPKIFPNLMINMVAAGEASGSLDISMERMATQFERSNKTQGMVKKAMMYPMMVCLVAIVVVIVMLVVVIPNYATMFEDMGTDLPGITLVVVAMSNFIKSKWFIILPVIAGIVFGIMQFKKTNTGKHLFGKLAITIPAIKNLVTKTATAQMARTLSTLMGAGVPMIEAVGIVSATMENVWFKEALEKTQDDIMTGHPLSVPLQECGLFPPMVYYMVQIGEETGNTEDMLDKLADYYEDEVEMAVQTFMAAMEPMIIIVLAGVVLPLMGACLAPMMKMYEALGNL